MSSTTPTRLVFANPDGSRTMRLSPEPVRFQDGAGNWHDDDFTLTDDGHGGEAPRSAPAGSAALTGSTVGTVATLGTPAGPVALAHLGAVAPVGPPVLGGRNARFKGVLGGRDLVTTVGLDALEESVVVPARSLLTSLPGAGSYVVTLTVPSGVTARQGAAGVELVDGSGAVVAGYGGGYAADSAVTGSGEGATAPVTSTLLGQVGPVVTVKVAVDSGWLADAARVFPVTIDPRACQMVCVRTSVRP